MKAGNRAPTAPFTCLQMVSSAAVWAGPQCLGWLLRGHDDPQNEVDQELRPGQQAADHEQQPYEVRGPPEPAREPGADSGDPAVTWTDQRSGHRVIPLLCRHCIGGDVSSISGPTQPLVALPSTSIS